MKEINKKLPIFKQAWDLTENFKEIGIKCVYNHRNRKVYLSLLNAPILVAGVSDAQMTLVGVFNSFSHVRDNFQDLADEYKCMYKTVYSDNPQMLKYLGQTDTSNTVP